jgi:hypothetical protein
LAPTATPGFLVTEGTEIKLKDTHNDDRETMIDNEGGHDKKKRRSLPKRGILPTGGRIARIANQPCIKIEETNMRLFIKRKRVRYILQTISCNFIDAEGKTQPFWRLATQTQHNTI